MYMLCAVASAFSVTTETKVNGIQITLTVFNSSFELLFHSVKNRISLQFNEK